MRRRRGRGSVGPSSEHGQCLVDHVKEPAGEKRDLVIPSHDVAAAQRTMAAVGVLDVGVLDVVSENQA